MAAESPGQISGGFPAPVRNRSSLATYAWLTLVARSSITMLVGFVTTPYLLRFLGAERLGAMRAAQQWSNYVNFLYVGLYPALMVIVVRAASRGDVARVASLTKAGIGVLLRQTLMLVFPAGLVVAWLMPELVPVSASLRQELRWGAIIGTFGLLLSPLDAFRSVLSSFQLGYLMNVSLSAQSVLIALGSVWLAWLGWGLPGQYAASVVGLAMFAALTSWFAMSHLSGFRRAPVVQIDTGELWRLRWPMLLTGIGGQMNILTDYIVVSLVADAAAVTTFSITQRLVMVLGAFVSSFSEVSWAGLAELRASGSAELFQRRALELIRLFLGAGLCLVVTFGAFNHQFVRLWVGHQYYGGDALSILTAAQTMVVGYFMFFGWTIDMAGDTRQRVPVTLAGAILNIALSVMLGRWLGLYGVTLATVIAYAAGEAWYSPYLFCTRYNVSGYAVAWESGRALVLASPWMVSVWWWVHRIGAGGGWMNFFIEFPAASLLAIAYAWFVILRSEDRRVWRMRLRTMSRAWGLGGNRG